MTEAVFDFKEIAKKARLGALDGTSRKPKTEVGDECKRCDGKMFSVWGILICDKCAQAAG